MPSTYTVNLGIEKPADGEQSGTWGDTTNLNFDMFDQAIDGAVTITLNSAGTSGSPNLLEIVQGDLSNGRNKWIEFADASDLGASAYVQLTPSNAEKIVFVRNSLSGNRSVFLFQGPYDAARDLEVPAGVDMVVKFSGGAGAATVTDVFKKLRATEITTPTLTAGTADINDGTVDAVIGGTTPKAGTFSSLTASTADINDGTVDAVIGGTTPKAGTFSSLTASTADINDGTVDAVIGGTTPKAGTFTSLTATQAEFSSITHPDNTGNSNIYLSSDGKVGIGAIPNNELDLGIGTNGRGISWGSYVSGVPNTYANIATAYSSGALTLSTNLAIGREAGDPVFAVGTEFNHNISMIRLGIGSDNTGIQFFTEPRAFRTQGDPISPTERMRIDPAGRVLIGTTSPTNSKLRIYKPTATTYANAHLELASDGTATDGDVILGFSATGNTGVMLKHVAGEGATLRVRDANDTADGNFRAGSVKTTFVTHPDNTGVANVYLGSNGSVLIGQDGITNSKVRLYKPTATTYADAHIELVSNGSATNGDVVLSWHAFGNTAVMLKHVAGESATLRLRSQNDTSDGTLYLGNLVSSGSVRTASVAHPDNAGVANIVLESDGRIEFQQVGIRKQESARLSLTNGRPITQAGEEYGAINFYGENSGGVAYADYAARIQVTHDPSLEPNFRGAAIRLWTGYTTQNAAERMRIGTQGDITFYRYNLNTPDFFWDAVNGRLGINTTTPVQKLHVKGTLRLEEDAAGRALDIVPAISGVNHRFVGPNTSAGFTFENQSGELFRVNNNGNVLIGTSSSVSSKVRIFKSTATIYTDAHLELISNGAAANGNVVLAFVASGVDAALLKYEPSRGLLLRNGNDTVYRNLTVNRLLVGKDDGLLATNGLDLGAVGCTYSINASNTYHVYNTDDSAYKFYVSNAGDVRYTSLNAISDEREKKNIRDLPYGLSEVKLLRPRIFDWDNASGGEDVFGFIAQEAEQVLPPIIGDFQKNETETRKSLNYTAIIPVLVNAIQEQQEIIESLEARIAALESA